MTFTSPISKSWGTNEVWFGYYYLPCYMWLYRTNVPHLWQIHYAENTYRHWTDE